MNSYHAIVACVAAGAGVAVVPESVLDIVDSRHIVRHALPRAHERFVTPLVWRTQEVSRALVALIESVKGGRESYRQGGRKARATERSEPEHAQQTVRGPIA